MNIREKLQIVTPRETAGENTQNLYDFQNCFAALLILDLMVVKKNFCTFHEYLDDIIFLDDLDNPTQITFYQVKTDSSNEITLTTILREKWFHFLNENISNFRDNDSKGVFVTNSILKFNTKSAKDKKHILHETYNSPICVKDFISKSEKEEDLLAEIESSFGSKVDFSKLYLYRTSMPISDHDTFLLGKLTDYLQKINSKLDAPMIKAIQDEFLRKILALSIDKYHPAIIDYNELVKRKSFSSNDFQRILSKANDTLVPTDFDKIHTFATVKLNIILPGNYISQRDKYRKFSVETIKNHKLYFSIQEQIKEIDINGVETRDLFSFLDSQIKARLEIESIQFYRDFREYIIALFVYRMEG